MRGVKTGELYKKESQKQIIFEIKQENVEKYKQIDMMMRKISIAPPHVMNLSKLFGSKCRVKILEKFVIEQALQNDAQGFFIRELCRDIDEQINSVRRELLNLEELKLLRSKEENKKKFYFLNKHNPIYEALVEIFLKNYDVIEELRKYFKGRKNVDLITVCEDIKHMTTEKSNNIVDIFIIGEIDKTEFNIYLEKIFFGRKIKYAVMSEADFTNRLEYSDKLVLSILQQKNNIFIKDRFGIQEKFLVKK
jgi:hypothetical protein